jgi:predicted pyridoxine 5'-phosphate oxidase superfamily flavin-nucleotide-binding protein
MAGLPAEARELIESDALAHLVTFNPDGSPQVTCIWVGVQGHELVSAHLIPEQQRMGGFGFWAGN